MLAEDDQPDRDSVLTPAGGRVEEGESAKDGAGRELLEETGYEAQKSVLWHTYRPNNKIEMTVHAFIGRNIKKVKEPHLDPGERIKPVFFTFDEFLELGQNPDLRDWFLRIKLLEAQIDPIKKDELKQLLYGN
jgi:ADP-ribose pyrophosphatase YjhB (NUDIX family)